ncbi:MAG: VanZ family protein [Campylobacter sp.]|nr:VanZ family protein [Campylobacter sp.]
MFYQICFVIAILAVEYLALTSRHIPLIENIWDKANHFIAFFVLYALFDLGFYAKIYTKFLALLAFGIQIELVQAFLPKRYFSTLDVLADTVGLVLGVIAMKIIHKVYRA